MEFQLYVGITCVMISASILFALFSHGQHKQAGFWPWAGVNILVILVGVAGFLLVPNWVGALAALVFVPLVFAPILFGQLAQRRGMMQRYGAAARFARLASFLRPGAQVNLDAEIYAALAHDNVERTEGDLLQLAEKLPAELQLNILVLLASRKAEWQRIIDLTLPEDWEGREVDPQTLPFVFRALGELARYDDMLAFYHHIKADLAGMPQPTCELFILAYCGHQEGVAKILSFPMQGLDPESKAYFTAIAAYYSGEGLEDGRRGLEELAKTGQRSAIRTEARRHLALTPAPAVGHLSPASRQTVGRIAQRAKDQTEQRRGGWRTVPVTIGLITANGLAYLVQLWTGAGPDNLEAMVALGAMWPPYVFGYQEWWRVFTAPFLHFGAVHLGANMLGLLIFGRLIETARGGTTMFLVFAVGGVMSSILTLGWMSGGFLVDGVLWGAGIFGGGDPDYAVYAGASGAIFALVGFELARQLLRYLISRESVDRRQVTFLLFIMAMQFTIDLSLPDISLSAHISGFLTGIFLGLTLSMARVRRKATL